MLPERIIRELWGWPPVPCGDARFVLDMNFAGQARGWLVVEVLAPVRLRVLRVCAGFTLYGSEVTALSGTQLVALVRAARIN